MRATAYSSRKLHRREVTVVTEGDLFAQISGITPGFTRGLTRGGIFECDGKYNLISLEPSLTGLRSAVGVPARSRRPLEESCGSPATPASRCRTRG